MKTTAVVLLFLLLSACATAPRLQSSELSSVSYLEKTNTQLNHVPFINQEAGHCGPASLAMMMGALSHPVELNQLTEQVYVPGAKGSFQTDMLSATRRQGLVALPVRDFKGLLQEVENGRPVLVFQNLAFRWYPQWHYAVVTGFDLNQKQVILHSGPDQFARTNFKIFEQSWLLGDYWAYTIVKPGELSKTATEEDYLVAALALEESGQVQPALATYLAAHKSWPGSLKPALASATLLYQTQKFQESHQILLLASKQHPQSYAAWNNLSVVQQKLGQVRQAKQSLAKAESLRKNQESNIETSQ